MAQQKSIQFTIQARQHNPMQSETVELASFSGVQLIFVTFAFS